MHILVPPHFWLVPPNFVCSCDGTAGLEPKPKSFLFAIWNMFIQWTFKQITPFYVSRDLETKLRTVAGCEGRVEDLLLTSRQFFEIFRKKNN